VPLLLQLQVSVLCRPEGVLCVALVSRVPGDRLGGERIVKVGAARASKVQGAFRSRSYLFYRGMYILIHGSNMLRRAMTHFDVRRMVRIFAIGRLLAGRSDLLAQCLESVFIYTRKHIKLVTNLWVCGYLPT